MNEEKNETSTSLEKLKREIQLQAKNGIDFIFAAAIVWFLIFLIWKYTNNTSYNKSVLTFIVGSILIPLALGLSKVLKTNWKIKDNPLQLLGLWLNFAQLVYFPFLIFILIKYPDYFIMAYAIITGAHLFPYSWFYDEIGYAVAAILISVGSMFIAIFVNTNSIFYIPIFTAFALLLLGVWILIRFQKLKRG